ncbi:MAG TPA: nitroreductase [Patescibacteria group bacterium]|nr:nitroreductase [Patescibacteria group bacterium]
MKTDKLIAAESSSELLEYLQKRRSVSIKLMTEPGPNRSQIDTILKAAMRVPDHGKMFPWHFIVFEGDARKSAGELLMRAWLAEEPGALPAKLNFEAERFLRAPIVIAVVSRVREGKNPLWEQILSAGAAAQNLCLAANALGFGTCWVTEWYSYSEAFRKSLGLDERDNIAGFVYIGTPSQLPEERDRPDPARVITFWSPDTKLNNGTGYGQDGMGLPRKGFTF